MKIFTDVLSRTIRLTDERLQHIETVHPEMVGQIGNIEETIKTPDNIIESRSDPSVELFYRHYASTPVIEKFLCIVIKIISDDLFVVTPYFTDSIKKGILLWEKK